jgi:hypothetical protein
MAEGGALEDCPRKQKGGRMGTQHGARHQIIFWKYCALLDETRPELQWGNGVPHGPDDEE